MAKNEKKTGKPSGFEEQPQQEFEGAPLSGSVEDWVKQLESEAERDARAQETREIRSKAGKHRRKAEKKAQGPASEGSEGRPKLKGGTKKADRAYTVGDKRTGGGVSIGGTNDPRERAAAGLNPVAGLDVSLEEASKLASTSGVTATVESLKALIDSGNPLFKDGRRHRLGQDLHHGAGDPERRSARR
jgi:excinuclease ABC subunit B